MKDSRRTRASALGPRAAGREVDLFREVEFGVCLVNADAAGLGAAAQLLAFDAGHVVARGTEELLCASAEVLVELELHCPEATATGTYRSRDISAP